MKPDYCFGGRRFSKQVEKTNHCLFVIMGCGDDDTEPWFETITDTDGNIYKALKTGDQIWMAENVCVTRHRKVMPFPQV
ncbi:MAG: hypothetical protein EA394_09305 [Bacteroidia bacterium]|nr:MAG: hypothetical protein EA394_09305 [Bacteroidia bacterium]